MAQLFTGRHEVPVDDKGRIFVPAEFRKKLPPEADDMFVIAPSLFDPCLTVYPHHVWKEIAHQLLLLPQTQPKTRETIRFIVSEAFEVKMDRQGRIGIPRRLLNRANINGQMLILGFLNKLEFWNPGDREESPPLEEVADVFDSLDIKL